MYTLQQFTADHRHLKRIVACAAGFRHPVLINHCAFDHELIERASHGEMLPIDGVLVTSWHGDCCKSAGSPILGMQVHTIEGVRFVVVKFAYTHLVDEDAFSYVAVERCDIRRLRAIARNLGNDNAAPILASGQAEQLWHNTIGFLEPENLSKFERYGVQARRGVLLTGSPGNGKTMACRWIQTACRQRDWSFRVVTPDEYRSHRADRNVEALFRVVDRGVVFFDDMDLALRDRNTVGETEDQSVFLTALDGMCVKRGVVFVFTTNCTLDLIDPAFKRPGRIDVVLPFGNPDASMRRELFARWHDDIRAHLDENTVVASTDGFSFAEIEELRNLLVMRYVERGAWDWRGTLEQFAANRSDFETNRTVLGFAAQV